MTVVECFLLQLDGKSPKKRRHDPDSKDKEGRKKRRTKGESPPARPLKPRPPSEPPTGKGEKKVVEDDMKLRVGTFSAAISHFKLPRHVSSANLICLNAFGLFPG